MIKSIAHICILTNDLDATEKFYCYGLGLTRKFDFLRDGKIVGYYLQINENNYIEVFLTDPVSSEEESRISHFCLEVEDINGAIDKIRECGIDITDKKMGCDKSWQAWLTDPNGIKIELHEYTEESCQILGNDCVVDF